MPCAGKGEMRIEYNDKMRAMQVGAQRHDQRLEQRLDALQGNKGVGKSTKNL